MRILILGSSAKEHALVWKFLASEKYPDPEIFVCPGNFALRKIAECLDTNIYDIDRILEIAIARNIDLTIVGESELFPLGIVDKFREAGKLIVGPSQAACLIESSTYYVKNLLIKHDIPCAKFAAFDKPDIALIYLKTLNFPVKIRSDNVFSPDFFSLIVNDLQKASDVINEIFKKDFFSSDKPKVIIEELLQGQEITINTIADGYKAFALPAVHAYREQDGFGYLADRGAFAPTPLLTDKLMAEIRYEIINPLVEAMAMEGCPYTGFLCFDIILETNNNKPKLNKVRTNLLDSDAQVVLPLLDENIYEVLLGCAKGDLSHFKHGFHKFSGSALTVNVVCSDKTTEYVAGVDSLRLLETLDLDLRNQREELNGLPLMFYGTKSIKSQSRNSFAEIFGATAIAENLLDAQILAYKLADSIEIPTKSFQRDIGDQGLIN